MAFHSTHLALTILEKHKKSDRPFWLITANQQEAVLMHQALSAFGNITGTVLPSLETLPYEAIEPHPEIRSQRLGLLHRWASGNHPDYVITSIAAIMPYLPPPSFVLGHCFSIKPNQTLPLDVFKHHLIDAGYLQVHKPTAQGEFAHRGGIVDFFPMSHSKPLRLEWFDDEIESIHELDPKEESRGKSLEDIHYFPAQSYHLKSKQEQQAFDQKWQEYFGDTTIQSDVYHRMIGQQKVPIADYFLPLLHPKMATAFDYFKHARIYTCSALEEATSHYWDLCQDRYQSWHRPPTHPLLGPQTVFLTPESLQEKLERYQAQKIEASGLAPCPNIATSLRSKKPLQALFDALAKNKIKIVIALPNHAEQSLLLELGQQHGLVFESITQWQDCLSSKKRLFTWVSKLAEGGFLEKEGIYLYTLEDLLPEHAIAEQKQKAIDTPTWDLAGLKTGDHVVHKKHGVARFEGIEQMHQQDFLKLAFLHNDRLYVPMHELHCLTPYGANASSPPINALHSKRWKEKRLKALQKIADTATELLHKRAQRALHKRSPYQVDQESYRAFCDEFAFQATLDQIRVMDEIIGDLSSDEPMDRLVCGDVGFGKTEIMMRTAFIAALSGHPVAILVPTTILAKQHFDAFEQRFQSWPIHLLSYTGANSQKEKNKLKAAMENKQVDVLIGTHALLTQALPSGLFKMIIVDEEHRFGVKQKEMIKRNLNHQDVLMLSATPIPRSLNMALSSLKDISLLATPPAKRIAVKTQVDQWSESLVREAIEREILRGGQVFLCYNQIETIQTITKTLQSWFPSLNIAYAHGQMPKGLLKEVMQRFYHQSIQVLICTTIIESGIDQPNANTILVHRADLLGLAQLHQLRGRVGRSHHQAYAYFTYLDEAFITSDAQKRLSALEKHHDIGGGFQLALQDLEIRGAGDLLGDQQSGHMQAIGLSLYTQSLQKAINTLKKDPNAACLESLIENDASLDVHHDRSAILPESYLPDVHDRLKWYHKLSECHDPNQLFTLEKQLTDQAGRLPAESKTLFELQKLRYWAKACGITAIAIKENKCTCTLSESATLDTGSLITSVQQKPDRYQLQPPHRVIIDAINTEGALAYFIQSLREWAPSS